MAAIEYLEKLGMERVAEHEGALASATVEQLAAIPGVTVYGPPAGVPRGAVVAFSVEGLHPHDVAALLDQQGIAVRAGHHCAQPLMRWCGVVGTARASFSVYSSSEEVAVLAHALAALRTRL
jgi:cysteine desulfurase/selenocysteine lyase